MRLASRLSLVMLVLGIIAAAGCAHGKEAVPPERHGLPPGVAFQSLHMVDEIDGWGVSSQGLFRTDSGGTQWANVTPPGISDVNQDDWFFASRLDAWVLVPGEPGGILYETHDGGETWGSAEVPFDGGSLFFVHRGSTYAGWALQAGAASGDQPVHLYSRDASGRWTLTHQGEMAGRSGPGLLPYSGMKYGPVFLANGKTGWITVEYRNLGKYGFYRTADGGLTWSLQDLPLPAWTRDSAILVEPPFLFAGPAGPASSLLSVRLSQEGGHSWVFFKSVDAGHSWQQLSTSPNSDGELSQAGFVDPQYGWVADSKALFLTDDGAKTWSKRTVPPGTQQVQFVSLDVGWALSSGERAIIYRTNDGGMTWLKTYPKE